MTVYLHWHPLLLTASWLRPWLLLRRWFCIYLLKRSQLNTLLIRVFSGDYLRCDCSVYVQPLSTVLNCLSILASLRVSASFLSFLVWLLSSQVWFCPSFGRQSVLLFRRSPSGLHTRTRSWRSVSMASLNAAGAVWSAPYLERSIPDADR